MDDFSSMWNREIGNSHRAFSLNNAKLHCCGALFFQKLHCCGALFPKNCTIAVHYFSNMEQAGMIGQLRDDTGGIRGLGKVEKVYLDNTCLAYLLGYGDADMGNIRETFFYNQMRVTEDVICSRISDFEIGGKTFEVGEKKKKKTDCGCYRRICR